MNIQTDNLPDGYVLALLHKKGTTEEVSNAFIDERDLPPDYDWSLLTELLVKHLKERETLGAATKEEA